MNQVMLVQRVLQRAGELMRAVFNGLEFLVTIEGQKEFEELEEWRLSGELVDGQGRSLNRRVVLNSSIEFLSQSKFLEIHYWKKERENSVEATDFSECNEIIFVLGCRRGYRMLKEGQTLIYTHPDTKDTVRLSYSNNPTRDPIRSD